MKYLRLSLAVCVLTLTPSAFAGDMETGFTSQPPVESTLDATGDIQNTVTSTSGSWSEATAGGQITEITLSFVQSLLALF